MNPQSHFINSHISNPLDPNERSVAVQIMEASHAERTHVARNSRPAKPSNQAAKESSDAASVSSFGSSVSLLKNKFHSSSSKKEKSSSPTSHSSSQKKILRNQVNIVG
ncbi:hypothetical protein NKR19_g7571 [Coniochaeta hoffmannii]|uniref:Uncharacterized protein n=1 Tax=Coniochaeta hoffmannii TaxID=91930 RepID=A0AA38VG27_9PEZI|nr:hypothetical protein NKR19_g7571 [Coniochaeta hoffmannii]